MLLFKHHLPSATNSIPGETIMMSSTHYSDTSCDILNINLKVFSDLQTNFMKLLFNTIKSNILANTTHLSIHIGTPADKEAIMSQLRVWPFPFTAIVIFGERSRNPDHHFAGVYNIMVFKPKNSIHIPFFV